MKERYRKVDPDYIAWIKTLPCVICLIKSPETQIEGKHESEPHHFNRRGHGGMAMKTHDRRAIPLCRDMHQEFHDQGRLTWMETHGVGEQDIEEIIIRLNTIWEELNEVRSGY